LGRYICIEEPHGADALQIRERDPETGAWRDTNQAIKNWFKFYRYLSNNWPLSISKRWGSSSRQ
tara:strand:- start:826 stop:1017 length:192 start_codon:yes stop_codon:yes gene_type:complete